MLRLGFDERESEKLFQQLPCSFLPGEEVLLLVSAPIAGEPVTALHAGYHVLYGRVILIKVFCLLHGEKNASRRMAGSLFSGHVIGAGLSMIRSL